MMLARLSLTVGLGLAGPAAAQTSPVVGEVALENNPFCDFLILRAADGFALARWRSGIYQFAEGDAVKGEPVRVGLHPFVLPEGEIELEVIRAGLRLRAAQRLFAERCRLEPDDDLPTVAAEAAR